jgi:GPI mannosyltransferase 3
MSRRAARRAFVAVVLVGLALRLIVLRYEPPHHPDEIFQYLEPGWLRLHGAGIEAWEWRDGVRSWVLPGYHGAWMALLMRLGVRDGVVLATFLRVHWIIVGLSLIWAGWRGGALLTRRLLGLRPDGPSGGGPQTEAMPGWQGGLVGASLCAAFPLLVRFSCHTLSELASLYCMTAALVLAAEIAELPGRVDQGKAVFVGLLTGLGICLRIQHAPVALPIGLLLLSRRSFELAVVAATASLPVLLFGLVDLLTWGGFLSSFVTYVKFNLLEGGAAAYGTSPMGWYWQQFFHRLPLGLPLLTLACVLGLRASWPFVSAAFGLVLALSTLGHKEERFVMLFWPLVLVAAAGFAGRLLAGRRRAVRLATGAALVLLLVDGMVHSRGNDFPDLFPERFTAQAWVGRQADVTGLLFDEPIYTGGYLWFGRPNPQVTYQPFLLDNPLFSHVLARRSSEAREKALEQGFVEVHEEGDFVVLRRQN